MAIRVFLTVFVTVLIAELGDKTQIATLLFSTNRDYPKILIFCAAASALIASTGIAVLLGNTITNYINPKILSLVAGTGFIIIGVWTIVKTIG
jgi:putative Ca2+/H+ antiporter (TMEM165/GDT1 family)